jgi:CRP/FNR family transcriptional regulator, cyclic AMP receptor protein
MQQLGTHPAPTTPDLSVVPVFAEIARPELVKLNALAHQMAYRAGEQVFRQGEDGIGVFVVTSGQFELRHELANGASRVETTLGTGGVFGLTSMLDDGLRRSIAYAATDGTCLVLTRMTFRQAIAANPGLAIEVMRAMARNLREVSALLDRD